MQNQKVGTLLGALVLVIIAITAGVFVWKVEKGEETGQVLTVKVQKDMVPNNDGQQGQQQEPIIADATMIKGWKKYTSSDKLFSIEYPNSWQISGTVFSDASGKKIAEFIPGATTLKENRQCFDSMNDDQDRVRIISKTDITINDQQGMLLIEKVVKDPGGGFWFPNIYCLKKEEKAFIMAFYSDNLNTDKRELFNKIISTLNF